MHGQLCVLILCTKLSLRGRTNLAYYYLSLRWCSGILHSYGRRFIFLVSTPAQIMAKSHRVVACPRGFRRCDRFEYCGCLNGRLTTSGLHSCEIQIWRLPEASSKLSEFVAPFKVLYVRSLDFQHTNCLYDVSNLRGNCLYQPHDALSDEASPRFVLGSCVYAWNTWTKPSNKFRRVETGNLYIVCPLSDHGFQNQCHLDQFVQCGLDAGSMSPGIA